MRLSSPCRGGGSHLRRRQFRENAAPALRQGGDDAAQRADLLLGEQSAAEGDAQVADHRGAFLRRVEEPGRLQLGLELVVKPVDGPAVKRGGGPAAWVTRHS